MIFLYIIFTNFYIFELKHCAIILKKAMELTKSKFIEIGILSKISRLYNIVWVMYYLSTYAVSFRIFL